MRVLVLGGTGVFGSRLCRLLAGDPDLTLTVAARDRAAVDALARELGVAGRAVDWRSGLDGVLGGGCHAPPTAANRAPARRCTTRGRRIGMGAAP